MRWAGKTKDRGSMAAVDGSSGRGLGVSPATLVRAGSVGLWVLVAVGVVSGVAALARPGPGAAPSMPPPASPVAPAGWAQLYVSAWLSAGDGDEDRLRSFFPGVPSLSGVRSGGLWAARTAAVAAGEVSPGYWSVTVAAEVMAAAKAGGWTPAGVRYYRVAVAATPGGAALVSTGLPAQVSAPALARAPRLAYQAAGVQVPGDLAESVERFVAAYVAGDGELARYVVPGSPVRPVRPAPYARVEISSVALDGPVVPGRPVRVLASVRATDPDGRVALLAYPLAVAAREGRWEVTELLAVPALAAPDGPIGTPPASAPTAPTSPSASTSSTSVGEGARLPGAPPPPPLASAAPSSTNPAPAPALAVP